MALALTLSASQHPKHRRISSYYEREVPASLRVTGHAPRREVRRRCTRPRASHCGCANVDRLLYHAALPFGTTSFYEHAETAASNEPAKGIKLLLVTCVGKKGRDRERQERTGCRTGQGQAVKTWAGASRPDCNLCRSPGCPDLSRCPPSNNLTITNRCPSFQLSPSQDVTPPPTPPIK